MYVCLCKAITDTQIRSAVDQGASSFDQVRDQLGVSTKCGACTCEVKNIVKTRLNPTLTVDTEPYTSTITEIQLAS